MAILSCRVDLKNITSRRPPIPYKDGRVERLLLHHLCQYRICQCCALRWVANLGMLMDVGDVGLSTMLVQRDGFRHFKT